MIGLLNDAYMVTAYRLHRHLEITPCTWLATCSPPSLRIFAFAEGLSPGPLQIRQGGRTREHHKTRQVASGRQVQRLE